MKEFLPILKKNKLFAGLSEQEIQSALGCLSATVKSYKKGEYVYRDSDRADFAGIILSGELTTQKQDYEGNSNMVQKLYAPDIIAASACYSTQKTFPFDVIAEGKSEVLFLDAGRLIQPCKSVCSFHTQLAHNMISIIADRNIMLAAKIDILTKRTIRQKVLSYLYAQGGRTQGKRFSVPMSRRQMAEFLSINRSALSRELGNLKAEGIIDFDANSFILS